MSKEQRRLELITLIIKEKINIIKEKEYKIEDWINEFIKNELYIDYLDRLCEKYFDAIPDTFKRVVVYCTLINEWGCQTDAAELFLDGENKDKFKVSKWVRSFNDGKDGLVYDTKIGKGDIILPTSYELNNTIQKIFKKIPNSKTKENRLRAIVLKSYYGASRKMIKEYLQVSQPYVSVLLKNSKNEIASIEKWKKK
jgi:hypothetical protein